MIPTFMVAASSAIILPHTLEVSKTSCVLFMELWLCASPPTNLYHTEHLAACHSAEPSHKSLVRSCAINVHWDLYAARVKQAVPSGHRKVASSLLLVTESPLEQKGPGACCCLERSQSALSMMVCSTTGHNMLPFLLLVSRTLGSGLSC